MVGVWVRRSLRHYRVRHLVFAGTVALTSAILCAALLTGESLRQGLFRDLKARLGDVRSAVYLSEGVFPASLAQRLPDTQAALLLKGELLTANGVVCAGRAQVIGMTSPSGRDGSPSRPPEESGLLPAALNARGREVMPGAEGAIRFEKPPLLSAELPLGAAKEERMVRRAVGLGPADGSSAPGRSFLTPDFALRAAPVPPVNIFLPFEALAQDAGVPGMANLLVSPAEPQELSQALERVLTPEDAGLVLETLRTPSAASRESGVVVKPRGVFLPRAVPEALAAAGLQPECAVFHLADAFGAGTNATPYGFVAGLTPDGVCVPRDLKDDEIVINAWLAGILDAKTNDTVTLHWRRFEEGGRLVPDSRAFRVREVAAMEQAEAVKAAMPVFPGLEGVDSCAAWDVGLPMDEEKLKDAANEAYWKQWRATPKAFLTFAAGKACFGTFFGETMSVRVLADEAGTRRALKALTPAQAGFVVRPVWREGVMAAQGSTDFRLLFAGMAFVLVAAALLLSALSLSLSLETRKGEVALFSALGWSRGKVVGTLSAEWGVPLAAGALAGGGFGAVLARALVWSLERFWRGAFAGAGVTVHFSARVAGVAAGAAAVLTLAVLLRTVSRFARACPVEVWQGRGTAGENGRGRGAGWESVAGGGLAAGALAVMALCPGGAAANGAFFGAGFLLLVSLLLFVKTAGEAWWGAEKETQGPAGAGIRRAVQMPRRSAPVVLLLAAGLFLSVGVLAMKRDPAAGCEHPWSGSGGFASIVTSVSAMERGRGVELARRVSGGKGVVPVRVHDGDEAGCLNMNRPQTPRLLGLDARAMARARAFEPEDAGGVWTLIERPLEDGAFPALAADQTMLHYSLKAKAGLADGTVLNYAGRDGTVWRVRIVGALPVRSGILQGALIVDERAFVKMFPDEGYRMWLCDYAPYLLREAGDKRRPARRPDAADGAQVGKLRHPEPGVTVETVEERLRLLGSVESAYLDMFLVLGGLGVVLGVLGIALVVLRSVEERRGELALMRAVGLPRRTVTRLLAAEYGVLALAGLVIGIVPALVAIQPAARALGSGMPWLAMAGILAGFLGSAAFCVVSAAWAASCRYGPEVLKEEV